ncbi:hypothetical protein [Mesorhizobium sp. B1-1-8]|uniref:hypothetical protein n=1 Tax=Mesorhizobium sp. B1-1-8 TaxID=2589976 RepID=UPI00112A30B7|nr:hypothetical protein [Mesorhizobium sp. B1-1-8]UCI09043.1 hypothetical protein FJ974_08260 [Mesorhizobium sp. B1-1-8]
MPPPVSMVPCRASVLPLSSSSIVSKRGVAARGIRRSFGRRVEPLNSIDCRRTIALAAGNLYRNFISFRPAPSRTFMAIGSIFATSKTAPAAVIEQGLAVAIMELWPGGSGNQAHAEARKAQWTLL